MKEIILIEIIAIVSYLYSILMMLFYFPPEGNQMGILFIWTILFSLIYALNYKRSKWFEASILIMLLPLIKYHDRNTFVFMLIMTLGMYMYIKTALLSGSHYGYVSRIKKSYIIYIPLIYFRFLMDNVGAFLPNALVYIIIYFLSSIMLARSIRHLDSNMDIGNIRRNNTRQLLIIGVGFFITTFEGFKDSLFFIGNKAIELIYYPMYLIIALISKLFTNEEVEKKPNLETSMPSDVEALEIEDLESIKKVFKKEALDLTVIKILLGVILLIVILYIVYRLIKKEGNRRYESSDFIEEREYIKQPKAKKKRSKREAYPTDPREQIRYYYRKFLNKLSKGDIEILNSDSSLDINEKAQGFSGQEIDRFRAIYIESRYSESDIDEDLVKEMESLYKRL